LMEGGSGRQYLFAAAKPQSRGLLYIKPNELFARIVR
jgi:hypothetical protein